MYPRDAPFYVSPPPLQHAPPGPNEMREGSVNVILCPAVEDMKPHYLQRKWCCTASRPGESRATSPEGSAPDGPTSSGHWWWVPGPKSQVQGRRVLCMVLAVIQRAVPARAFGFPPPAHVWVQRYLGGWPPPARAWPGRPVPIRPEELQTRGMSRRECPAQAWRTFINSHRPHSAASRRSRRTKIYLMPASGPHATCRAAPVDHRVGEAPPSSEAPGARGRAPAPVRGGLHAP